MRYTQRAVFLFMGVAVLVLMFDGILAYRVNSIQLQVEQIAKVAPFHSVGKWNE